MVALVLAALGSIDVVRGLRAASWPTTAGTVTVSEIDATGEGHDRLYSARVRYRYEVHGHAYEGSRAAFGDSFAGAPSGGAVHGIGEGLLRWLGVPLPPPGEHDSVIVEEYRKRYPFRAQATVHYHPDRPEDSVLETDPEWASTRLFVKAFRP